MPAGNVSADHCFSDLACQIWNAIVEQTSIPVLKNSSGGPIIRIVRCVCNAIVLLMLLNCC